MRGEINAALSTRLQDQKVVEIEITEKVVDRLKELGKIVGIPLALLAAVLSLWGIHSMSDVDVKIKKATDEAVANMNTKVNEATQKSIGDLNARVTKESDGIVQQARENARESLKTTVDSATKDLELRAKGAQSQFDHLKNRADDMQNQAEVLSKAMNRIGPQIASFDKRLGSVETTVEGLVKTVACDTENDRPVSSIEECHTNYPNGCSVAARYDAYLNSLKNRMPNPDSVPSHFMQLEDFVALDRSASHITAAAHEENKLQLEALGEGKIFAVIGYLTAAKMAGAESVNCQLRGEHNVDFMLSVGFDARSAAALRSGSLPSGPDRPNLGRTGIVAEMTPYYRAKFHPTWTIARLSAIVGRQIKIVGQLMIDSEHLRPTEDCSLPDADQSRCWRASSWELHPVTELYVCTSDAPCSQDDPHWIKFELML